jgi:uncharacterized SAM-binding protein YcdF (DUF218 family)
MLYIHTQFLLYLLQPLVWLIVLFIYTIFCRHKLRQKKLFIFVLAGLIFFANPFIIGKVFNAYEEGYPTEKHYQIGIVLGGFAGYDEERKQIMFSSSGDRLFEAIKLYRQGRIEQILISGGNSNLLDNKIREADIAAAYLRKIGIPDSVILVENESRNTVENAILSFKKVQEVNPHAKILVVTSAWHIPRARLNFSKYFKQDIFYYPSNYMGKTHYNLTDYFLPSFSSFQKWNFMIKEWAGLIVDRFRG